MPDAENRDLRQLLWHRHRLVQMRTRVMNQLHVVALNEGLRRKKALWRPAGRAELEGLVAGSVGQPTPARPARLTRPAHAEDPGTERKAGSRSWSERPVTRQLSTHPGVGPLTALAFELVIGTPERFACAKQIASYVGLVPSEESSGDRRRLGHISKQGNAAVALPAGGSGAGHGAQRSAMAQPVLSPGHAARAKDRESRDGPETGGRVVLDVAARMGLQRNAAARFARGRARKSPWCAVNHRRNDWVSRSPSPGEFEVVIMIEVAIEEMVGSD